MFHEKKLNQWPCTKQLFPQRSSELWGNVTDRFRLKIYCRTLTLSLVALFRFTSTVIGLIRCLLLRTSTSVRALQLQVCSLAFFLVMVVKMQNNNQQVSWDYWGASFINAPITIIDIPMDRNIFKDVLLPCLKCRLEKTLPPIFQNFPIGVMVDLLGDLY